MPLQPSACAVGKALAQLIHAAAQAAAKKIGQPARHHSKSFKGELFFCTVGAKGCLSDSGNYGSAEHDGQ